jgi:glycyl-tRNA synthetase alpha chain
MFVQKKKSISEIKWTDHLTYGEVHPGQEKQFSHYCFEEADVENLRFNFDRWEKEVLKLAAKGYHLPAFDLVMKCSQNFNLLDARGAISVSERAVLIKRIRDIAKACASSYVETNEPSEKKENSNA